jgi:cell division protein FtsW
MFDPILTLAQLLLLTLGLLGVTTAAPDLIKGDLMRIGVAVLATVVAARFQPRWPLQAARGLFLLSLLLLVVVLIIGHGPQGPKFDQINRWIDIGPFDFQPSELAKLAVILYLAAFFHRHPADYPILGPVIAITLTAFLIVIEPDFDTGLFVLLLAALLLILIGVPWRRLLTIGGAALLVLLAFSSFYLKRFDYVQERFGIWKAYIGGSLNRGDGVVGNSALSTDDVYQIVQGHKIILKAGVFGQGPGSVMPHYLPQAETDWVFAPIIWAGGWVAGLMVLLAFGLIFARGLHIAAHAEGSYSVMAVGLTLYLSLQAALNIGQVLGFVPVSGAPMPLVSFGGTSMLIGGISLGILHSLSRAYVTNAKKEKKEEPVQKRKAKKATT